MVHESNPNDYAAGDAGNASGRYTTGSNGIPPMLPSVKSVWLDAFNDPVAGISAYTPCVHTCNLFGDGENRLVIADEDRKLKARAGWLGHGRGERGRRVGFVPCSHVSPFGQPQPLASLSAVQRTQPLLPLTYTDLEGHAEGVRAPAPRHTGSHLQLHFGEHRAAVTGTCGGCR